MENVSVVRVDSNGILFDNGVLLTSDHDQDCCEHHYLSFDDLKLEDFAGLEFDLTGESFFQRIPDYGIELIPNLGWAVKIPGYGSNNGYYSSNLDLILVEGSKTIKRFEIDDCQDCEWY